MMMMMMMMMMIYIKAAHDTATAITQNNVLFISNIYNRRQNELRHFAQNWAFSRFMDFKRRKYSFPPPSPPCNVVPLF